MEWVMIGIVAGSLVTSLHPTKEACLGRVEILKEQKISAKCVEMPALYGSLGTASAGSITLGMCASTVGQGIICR